MRCLVLCEPAQSKCTWTFHKSHVVVEIYREKCRMLISGAPVSCEPAQSKCTWTFHKSHVVWKFTGKVPDANPRHPFCASLRNRNAHGHFTRAILCGNLQEKCWTLISGPLSCASLRSRNAHGHFTRAILCENLQGKCRTR